LLCVMGWKLSHADKAQVEGWGKNLKERS
jgi:hypothetical protein